MGDELDRLDRVDQERKFHHDLGHCEGCPFCHWFRGCELYTCSKHPMYWVRVYPTSNPECEVVSDHGVNNEFASLYMDVELPMNDVVGTSYVREVAHLTVDVVREH